MTDLLETLNNPPPSFRMAQAARVAERAFGLRGDLTALGGERDRNFLLRTDGAEVLIKAANSAEPDDLLACQCAALRHIASVDPALPVPRVIQTRQGQDWALGEGDDGSRYRVRAFGFLDGLEFSQAPDDPRLMRQLGRVLARLDRALQGFFHHAAAHPLAWDIKSFNQLTHLIALVMDDGERQMVEHVRERFQDVVHPAIPGLRAQVIHNDLSYHNAVVEPASMLEISGVFDFGDIIHAPLIQDLAVTAAEVPAGRVDPIARCAEIVAGFHSVTPLEDVEFSLLPDMIAARLALGIIIDAWSGPRVDWKDERAYLAGWRPNAVSMLRRVLEAGPERIEKLLRATCGLHGKVVAGAPSGPDLDTLWSRRLQRLGNAQAVSYDRPLHLVRGEGVWLYDAAGKAYLDAYNNVPHVGHCHPRVVGAVAGQTATLNTNTRYVYESILNYAERLAATMPAGLDVCFFVSSGSEANDLAWRLAKSYTLHTGAIVIDDAYHGITDATFDLSPSGADGQRSDYVATIGAPDDFRGPWRRDVADRGRRYAGFCDDAVRSLGQRGHAPAAFFMDSILSSSGIFVPPPGYVKSVFSRVRAAGGLCVADEVQSGFGRMGKWMWGFGVDDVVPDIVTLGKPIAGGYPMGVVVTTREIADRFRHFFSTTGGNPVACASALAVLDVIEDEGLLAHADRVGSELLAGIRQLATKTDLIGDVRGSGLFIGVDLVRDRVTAEPASEEARTVVNLMREDGVLIGRDGPAENVLKIRPPMVFNSNHADRLVQGLSRALDTVTKGLQQSR